MALISLVSQSLTLPASMSVGSGSFEATLRCAINLTASPSPTEPLTKSVVVFSSSSSSISSDTNDQEREAMRIDVADRIIVARVGLLLRHPFFGNMATRLIVKHCDDWCPTAATDGRHLYYNTQFFNALSNKEIEFVIAHEILHCVFDHIVRREGRIPILHNIVCDYKFYFFVRKCIKKLCIVI